MIHVLAALLKLASSAPPAPGNAVTHNGEVVTHNGEPVTHSG